MSFKSFNASQKKMYIFALFVVDTLKNTGIVREDFDVYNLDLSLVDTFDYDAFTATYKAHFKKPRANKILKHSSEIIRDISNDVVVTLANEYYENNIHFDSDPAAAAVDVEKPKRKYSRKSAAAADVSIDDLSSALDNMIIQTESIAAVVNTIVAEKPKNKRKPKAAAADVTSADADTVIDAEKPKNKRKPKAAAAAAVTAVDLIETAADDETSTTAAPAEKPKNKVTRKPKAAATAAALDDPVTAAAPLIETSATDAISDDPVTAAEKPKNKVTRKPKSASAVSGSDHCPENEKNKRKYTKKTANHYIDDSVPEFTAKIVNAAICGVTVENENENENIHIVDTDCDTIKEEVVAAVPTNKPKATKVKKVKETLQPLPVVVVTEEHDNHDYERPSTPILSVENELTTEDDYVNDTTDAYYTDAPAADNEDEDGADTVATTLYNIRGTEYLIGENNSIYNPTTLQTIGKYDSKVGVTLYNK
jgi:hypothetical protein